jgi:hypothetical protein
MISFAPRLYRWHTDRARLVLTGNKRGDSFVYQIATLHKAGPATAGCRGWVWTSWCICEVATEEESYERQPSYASGAEGVAI